MYLFGGACHISQEVLAVDVTKSAVYVKFGVASENSLPKSGGGERQGVSIRVKNEVVSIRVNQNT